MCRQYAELAHVLGNAAAELSAELVPDPAREKKLLDEKVYKLIKKIHEEKKDITDDYHDWYCIGCALAHEYGKEEGLRLFHLVSMHSKKYYPTDCDEQFAKCLRSRKIGIETFLWICKKHGVTFK